MPVIILPKPELIEQTKEIKYEVLSSSTATTDEELRKEFTNKLKIHIEEGFLT